MDSATGPADTFVGPLSSSTLDYILVPSSMTDGVRSCFVEDEHPLNTSDHLLIFIRCLVKGLTVSKEGDFVSEKIRWDKLTTDDLRAKYTDVISTALSNFNTSLRRLPDTTNNIDTAFGRLVDIVHNSARHLPRSRYRRHIKPFWNSQLKGLKLMKVSAYRVWISVGKAPPC